jgi:PPM family protein phosphatase
MEISGKTDKGRKRQNNEDTFVIDPDLGLMIVADGMGGHNAGEVASNLAANLCVDQLKRALKTGHVPVFHHVPPNPKLDSRSLLLGDCIKFSNQAVFEAGQSSEANKHMGTTLVAALWLDDKLAIAHVGDSRLYLVRNGRPKLCTEDHSFVQEQVSKGLISAEDAEKSDFKNMLTRSVGTSDDVDVDIQELTVNENDYILLCSDGLTKNLTDKQIEQIFQTQKEPQKITDELIRRANEAGGTDNITVVVARVGNNSFSRRVKKIFQMNNRAKGA